MFSFSGSFVITIKPRYLFYQLVSLRNYFFKIKHNKHYYVTFVLFAYVVIKLHVSMGHPQSYAIQALVTASIVNSYFIHAWFLILQFFNFDVVNKKF
jgi:hypothetical protein